MKLRFINALILLAFTLYAFIACNSDERKSEVEVQCSSYDFRYGELKELIKAISNHSTYQYKSYSMWDENVIQDVRKMILGLDSINCDSKKNIDFANNQVSIIQDYLTKEKQRKLDESVNGDDLFMGGVQITSSRILFDDDMNPFVEMSLTNNTNKQLTALRFLINYCSNDQLNQLCYKLTLIKQDISPFSSKTLSFSLPKPIQMATDHPKVELVEILRADGVKVKTADGFRFSQH